jgi:hypothetical protein
MSVVIVATNILRSSWWSGWLFTNVVCVTWVYYDPHDDLVDCSPMLYVSLEFTTILVMIWLTVHQCCMCHLSLLRSSWWSGWLFTNVVCVTWVYYDPHDDLVDCSPMLYVSLEFTTRFRVSVAHIVLLVFVFTFLVPCFEIRCKFRIKRYSVCLYPQLIVWRGCLIFDVCVCLRIIVSNTCWKND